MRKVIANNRLKLASLTLAICSINVIAAPGTLTDIPLNLGTTVQPNVLLLVDDSGSMGWEVLKTPQAVISEPVAAVTGTVSVAYTHLTLPTTPYV